MQKVFPEEEDHRNLPSIEIRDDLLVILHYTLHDIEPFCKLDMKTLVDKLFSREESSFTKMWSILLYSVLILAARCCTSCHAMKLCCNSELLG